MDESRAGDNPSGSSPQLIAKDLNNGPDTKLSDISDRDCSERMCDDASGSERHGAAASRQIF